MAESKTIRWEQDSDGIVTLTLDDPNQSANTMNANPSSGRTPKSRCCLHKTYPTKAHTAMATSQNRIMSTLSVGCCNIMASV